MESDLNRVADAKPGLIWTARPDGQFDFVNRWCDYTGLGVDEAYGCGWLAVIHPEDLPGFLEHCTTVIASGELRETEALQARRRRVAADRRFRPNR